MCKRRRHRISLLVPLGGDDPARRRAWEWLQRYWRDELPGVEIVIGRDRKSERSRWRRRSPRAFSKAVAVNDAFRRSHGDVIVILDSDAYLAGSVIAHCAERLRKQREAGVRSWFIPYDHLYRLNRSTTGRVLRSDPRHPLRLPSPPPPSDIDGNEGSGPLNVFGAMCQIMPREAFIVAGGMQEKFIGWGGEDYAFAQALDTLWGPHKTTPNDILHLWHPRIIGGRGADWTVRMWANQLEPRVNDQLAAQYSRAFGKPEEMRKLQSEWK